CAPLGVPKLRAVTDSALDLQKAMKKRAFQLPWQPWRLPVHLLVPGYRGEPGPTCAASNDAPPGDRAPRDPGPSEPDDRRRRDQKSGLNASAVMSFRRLCQWWLSFRSTFSTMSRIFWSTGGSPSS